MKRYLSVNFHSRLNITLKDHQELHLCSTIFALGILSRYSHTVRNNQARVGIDTSSSKSQHRTPRF